MDLTYGEVEQRLDLLQQHLNRYTLVTSGCTPQDARVDLSPPPRVPWQEGKSCCVVKIFYHVRYLPTACLLSTAACQRSH